MHRRTLIKNLFIAPASLYVLGLSGCGQEPEELLNSNSTRNLFDERGEIILYDTHAMALYYDGSLGPKTGIIKVHYLIDNKDVVMDFWHGHGSQVHRFTVTPIHFAQLKEKKKVTVETTRVDGHSHKLFIDMQDPKWRVSGALPITVPIEDPVHF